MAVIRPFKALRPAPEFASKLASRPYDVLNRAEAGKEAEGNPCSFYHITKAEIDLPDTVDIHDQKVYEKAADNLKKFRKEGYLFQEEKPCYYIYRLEMDGHVQTGLVAASSVGDYEQGVIKKHELTRPEKEQDRIAHILKTRAQTGNVFLAYPALSEINILTNAWIKSHDPLYGFTAEDKIHHSVWKIDASEVMEEITTLFATKVPATYIADGHHRAASAAKAANPISNEETYDREAASSYFLTTLFPDDQLHIIDYNRVVKDLNGLQKDEFLSLLEYDFVVTKIGNTPVKPAEPHEFGMYLDGDWYRLLAENKSYSNDPIGILDVSILQNNVLAKHLGINDPRTDQRIDFVGGIRGLEELAQRVDSGEMKVAFAVHPVTMAQLFEVADTGQIMPPKSTWFEPKLRDGLLTHLI